MQQIYDMGAFKVNEEKLGSILLSLKNTYSEDLINLLEWMLELEEIKRLLKSSREFGNLISIFRCSVEQLCKEISK